MQGEAINLKLITFIKQCSGLIRNSFEKHTTQMFTDIDNKITVSPNLSYT